MFVCLFLFCFLADKNVSITRTKRLRLWDLGIVVHLFPWTREHGFFLLLMLRCGLTMWPWSGVHYVKQSGLKFTKIHLALPPESCGDITSSRVPSVATQRMFCEDTKDLTGCLRASVTPGQIHNGRTQLSEVLSYVLTMKK